MKLPSFIKSSKTDPVLSINFLVLFNVSVMGFQSVSGISCAQDREFIQEGGRNGYPIPLRIPRKDPYKLTFKRGYIIRNISLAGVLGVSNPFNNIEAYKDMATGLILVLGSNREIKAMYGFISDGMLDWSVSDLDANTSNQLIETFTIVHRGLKVLPVPSLSLF